MLSTTRIALFLLASSILAACRTDDEEVAPVQPLPPSNLEVAPFSNLETGNYWVYQRYKVDSADNILEVYSVDTFFVSGDSVVNGETYAKVSRDGISPNMGHLWRDSANCVVTADHKILFCSDPFDEVIYTVYQGPVGVILDYSVYSTPESVTVAAGTFSTYKMQCEITSIGGFPEQPDWKRLRSYWAEGVGRVRYYEFYSSAPYGYRYDLVNYYVAE